MKLFLILFSILLQSSQSLAGLCSNMTLTEESRVQSDAMMYFLMHPLYKGGHLDRITESIPHFVKMGVRKVWLSPVHPQSDIADAPPNPHRYDLNSVGNDHYYWPTDHGGVAAKIGGTQALQNLIDSGIKAGIEIILDAPINHFGYGKQVHIEGKTFDLSDPNFFKVRSREQSEIAPEMIELDRKMSSATTLQEIMDLHKKYVQYPIYWLPGIRHDIPFMANYVISSYKKFVRMGVGGFRIDAAKQVDQDFLANFVTELQKTAAQSRMPNPKFYLESIAETSTYLEFFVRNLYSKIPTSKDVYFLDFPLVKELRRIADPNFNLSWIQGFLNYRWKSGFQIHNLVPFIENHDFETPIQDPFYRKLMVILTHFFSNHAPILHHGLENSTPPTWNPRREVESLNPEADLPKIRNSMEYLFQDRTTENEEQFFQFLVSESQNLVVERKISDKKSVFLLLNLGTIPNTIHLNGQDVRKLKIRLRISEARSGNGNLFKQTTAMEHGTTITVPPRSVIVIERTFP
ncbi:MAG: hypothetical protein K2X47_01305 [Bdellovibrionales bacterium]|nr:hypothetical protein [Bdellovibrionales bacterium]